MRGFDGRDLVVLQEFTDLGILLISMSILSDYFFTKDILECQQASARIFAKSLPLGLHLLLPGRAGLTQEAGVGVGHEGVEDQGDGEEAGGAREGEGGGRSRDCWCRRVDCWTLLFEALMKLVQFQWKSFLNKNLPSLMIYVHKNQCQFFHISNGII